MPWAWQPFRPSSLSNRRPRRSWPGWRAWQGVGLLGAGLAPAALGSRIDGLVVGVALGIGVPVAAVTSALIGTFMAGSALHGFDEGGRLAGQVLRGGVGGAVRLSPLIALASTIWVVMVRHWGRAA